MENYEKGHNKEENFNIDEIDIPHLKLRKDKLVWMKVKCGSSIKDLLKVAQQSFSEGKDVLWTGSGAATAKAISCAEIQKRKVQNVYQFNAICSRKDKEYWCPKTQDLAVLEVSRDVPTIHILLSHIPAEGHQDEKWTMPPIESSDSTLTGAKRAEMETYGLRFTPRKKNTKNQKIN